MPVEVTTAEEVFCVVEQAKQAAEVWRMQSVEERIAALAALRRHLAADAETIAQIVAEEIGKPLQEAYGADLLPSLQSLRWLERQTGRLLHSRRLTRTAWLEAQPLGVVGVIGTWNYPLFLNMAPIAWALAAGNAVVWKPSELATRSALVLASHFARVRLPVFVVWGDGEVGRWLCRAGCDKIAFTGSVPTGRAILRELATTGTPSVMELSGKDAMIVCADADVGLAARSAVWGRVSNAGQSCVAPQRILVAQEVYEPFLQACLHSLQALRPGVEFGPLRTEALQCQVHQYVQEAVQQGARLLAGGSPLPNLSGPFYAPTLLADCTDTMAVMHQDFFGPVLAVSPIQNEAEAIIRVNQDAMALGASLWTRHEAHGRQLASQLRVGFVTLNDLLLDAAHPALPFGGLRASGFGKQRGAMGLEEFVCWKVVASHSSQGTRRHLFPYRPETLPILQGMAALHAAPDLRAKWQVLRQLLQAMRRFGRSG